MAGWLCCTRGSLSWQPLASRKQHSVTVIIINFTSPEAIARWSISCVVCVIGCRAMWSMDENMHMRHAKNLHPKRCVPMHFSFNVFNSHREKKENMIYCFQYLHFTRETTFHKQRPTTQQHKGHMPYTTSDYSHGNYEWMKFGVSQVFEEHENFSTCHSN